MDGRLEGQMDRGTAVGTDGWTVLFTAAREDFTPPFTKSACC